MEEEKIKQYDVFFNDKRIKPRGFLSYSVKDVLRVLAMKGIIEEKIKQIQSEGKIINFKGINLKW